MNIRIADFGLILQQEQPPQFGAGFLLQQVHRAVGLNFRPQAAVFQNISLLYRRRLQHRFRFGGRDHISPVRKPRQILHGNQHTVCVHIDNARQIDWRDNAFCPCFFGKNAKFRGVPVLIGNRKALHLLRHREFRRKLKGLRAFLLYRVEHNQQILILRKRAAVHIFPK